MKEDVNDHQTEKVCKNCNKVKPLSEFGLHTASKDGLRPDCKKCTSDKNTEARRTRMQNPNYRSEQNAKKQAREKERMKTDKEFHDKQLGYQRASVKRKNAKNAN